VQLLEHITRHRHRSRLLVVATSDASASADAPASALWTRLVSAGLASRLPIAGLALEEVVELLGVVANRGDEPLPALAAAVHALTEGIPLFVVEVGRSLADLDARTMLAAGDLAIPERVQATLERRINRVPTVVVTVLRTAAIIGETFDAGTLAALTHQTTDALASQFAVAVRSGLIREDGPGRYRFAHRLLHRALDNRVGSRERGELHAELATLLDGPDPPLRATAAEVAHHFRLATFHHADQATTYSERAGDQAMAVLAFEDAEQHYQRALDTLQACEFIEPGRQGHLLLALGRARQAAYRRLSAMASFRQAAQLFVADHDRDGLTAAAWGLMTSTEFSVAEPDVVALFRDALGRCDPHDGTLRARLTAGLGRVLPAGDAEGTRLAAEAVTMARALGDPETAAIALSAAVLTCWAPDNLAWRQQTTDEVVGLAERLGWIDLAVEARNWRAAFCEERGDLSGADEDLAVVNAYATQSRRPFFCGLAAMRQAGRAVLHGRYADAEQAGHRMLEAGGEGPDFIAGFGAQLLLIRRDQGRLDELDALVTNQLSAAPHVPAWRVAKAVCDADLGRHDRVRQELRPLVAAEGQTLPRDWLWLLPMTLLADVCATVGEDAMAPLLIAALAPYEARVAVLGHGIATTGSVAGPLGRLEALIGDDHAAEDHLRLAIETDTRIGARPALVRAQRALATLLDRRGEPAAATALRVETASVARQIGMVDGLAGGL
jgi:tetratricopeptide (TPR) repeat protein